MKATYFVGTFKFLFPPSTFLHHLSEVWCRGAYNAVTFINFVKIGNGKNTFFKGVNEITFMRVSWKLWHSEIKQLVNKLYVLRCGVHLSSTLPSLRTHANWHCRIVCFFWKVVLDFPSFFQLNWCLWWSRPDLPLWMTLNCLSLCIVIQSTEKLRHQQSQVLSQP